MWATITPILPAAFDLSPEVVRTEKMIMDHLGLADAIARRFARRGEDEDDLRQVARTGLVEAAHRYVAARGEFPPFAAATITGAIKRQFRDRGWLVRPPRRTQELIIAMRPVWAELAQSLGSEPNSRQLADRLGVTEQEVLAARRAGQGYRAVWNEDFDHAQHRGATANEDEWSRLEARMVVRGLLAELDDAERELLQLRFVEQRTQSDIADRLDVSQMQVSRLLTRVFGRLRELLGEPLAA